MPYPLKLYIYTQTKYKKYIFRSKPIYYPMLEFNCFVVRDEKKGNVEEKKKRRSNDRLGKLMYISKTHTHTHPLFFFYVLLSIIAWSYRFDLST